MCRYHNRCVYAQHGAAGVHMERVHNVRTECPGHSPRAPIEACLIADILVVRPSPQVVALAKLGRRQVVAEVERRRCRSPRFDDLHLVAGISHVSLLVEVVSCGFAFAVINVERGLLTLDDAALRDMGALVDRRTRLYTWAWRLAVLGGLGFALLVGVATFH